MSQDNIPEHFRQRIQDAKEQQLEELDLSNHDLVAMKNQLTRIPDEVFELKHLKVLNIKNNRIYELPESFGNLTDLTWLNLEGNQLSTLPESFGNLTDLTWLNLEGNQLSTLPEFLGNFANLTNLGLGGNQLPILPRFLENLTNLTNLDLRGSQFLNLPEFLGDFTNLTHLDLGNNQLSSLPEFLGNLTNLTWLYLGNNQLSSLPEFLVNLTNLTYLNLGSNQLSSLPEFLGNLTNLTHLGLGNNQLSSLPEFLGNLTNLTHLDLGNNQLSSLPESLGKLANLTHLNLEQNLLCTFSKFLGNLTSLICLDLRYNKLSAFPDVFGNLTSLTSLDLGYNKLPNIPEFLGNLTKLTYLYLDRNQLSSLPDSLGILTRLTHLDLQKNQLSSLPKSFDNLTGLNWLNLRNNQLSGLPESITNLSSLTTVDLRNNQIKKIPLWLAENKLKIIIDDRLASECINLFSNPIEEPPLEVVKQGNESIVNYYVQIATQGKDYLYEAKMLIVGEGGAGKTTLAHKIEDTNCPLPYIDDRTRGITINTHSFPVPAQNRTENRQFLLNVWDFGGQEIYHATHRFFLSKRSLYVLVADNRKDDTDFNYWLNIIELFAGDSPIIIVLNEKDDLPRTINASELRSRYPESLKEILSVNFKTREEIDIDKRQQRLKLIRQLISDIEHCAGQLSHIGEPVPALWVDIRQAIENDSRNYIYSEQFFQICDDQGITDDRDIVTLLSYFHDLGIVMHFADNTLLRDRVILKPAWATNAVYRIFDNYLIIAKQGRFTRADCSALWSDAQYNYMHDVLIELMKNFLLIYEIDNTGNLIAPQMLPKDTPQYNWDDTNNSLMQLRYDLFMPKGILWQFIVTMYRYIQNHDWVWREGVILERDGTQAEVKENLSDRRIYLRFSGTSIAEFRAIIADQLDEINQSYHKLQYEKMVPCSCSICRSSSQPHFFKFSVLKKRQEKGKKHTIECEISEHGSSRY